MNKQERQKQQLREQTQREQQREANELRFDFDQAIKEANVGKFEIKFKDEIYELPTECPADLLLKILDDPENPKVVSDMIGSKLADEIKNSENVPVSAFTQLIDYVKDQWGISNADDAKNMMTPGS